MTNPLPYRIGLGHDRHRLEEGYPLILGGVTIPYERGLVGHSDADALLHALTDALLGAVGAGDIGTHFPNTDPQWSGADSTIFLQAAIGEVERHGYVIGNVDCTVFAEQPKLSPHRNTIRERLAELLALPIDRVNVKAKTGERVGPIGRGEAIDTDAVVLLIRKTDSP